jgi:hypothetical protein
LGPGVALALTQLGVFWRGNSTRALMITKHAYYFSDRLARYDFINQMFKNSPPFAPLGGISQLAVVFAVIDAAIVAALLVFGISVGMRKAGDWMAQWERITRYIESDQEV